MSREIRETARWGKDTPLSEETQDKLIQKLVEKYGAAKVRRAILVLPDAVEKIIDNEEDAQETLRRFARKKD